MTDADFEKITPSDKKLYGPRKLLLCGFPAKAQPMFMSLFEIVGIADLPIVWATEDQSDDLISDLFNQPEGFGRGESSSLPRAIVATGILEKELHLLMSACRQSGMQQALWATLTPTSETWRLGDLLAELAAEREALKK